MSKKIVTDDVLESSLSKLLKKEVLQNAIDATTNATAAATTANAAASTATTATTNANTAASNADKAALNANSAAASLAYILSGYRTNRNGKVYGTRIYKYESNPTSTGLKLLHNEGLVCEPSTDTVIGQDDYANINIFEWVHVNYTRESDGFPIPTAVEGDADYATTGSVDVGTMAQTFFWGFKEYDEYTDYYMSDSPNALLGLNPWYEAVRPDGTVMPYYIGSSYYSGYASDGLLRSQPGLPCATNMSYTVLMSLYPKKGDGYFGGGISRFDLLNLMLIIKYGTKNSKNYFKGQTDYSYQYAASIQAEEAHDYFPVANAQAANLEVGTSVIIGYPTSDSIDRSVATMKSYSGGTSVCIKSIEKYDDSNSIVRFEEEITPFSTMPVNEKQVYISTYPQHSGSTDYVIGHHDGSRNSNTNGKNTVRVHGREYLNGAYYVASDVLMIINSDYDIDFYRCALNAKRYTSENDVKTNYEKLFSVAKIDDSNNGFYAGNVKCSANGVFVGYGPNATSTTGTGCYVYRGGQSTGVREALLGGYLWDGSFAGSLCLLCRGAPADASWRVCAGD